MFRSVQIVILAAIVGAVACDTVGAQVPEHPELKALKDGVARVLEGTAARENLDGNDSRQVPALITALENGDEQQTSAAMRALSAMKSKASPAIVAISKKLSDRDHATRSAAVEALVSIGNDAVVPLRKLLTVSTGRTRAAAARALIRLKRLEVDDVAKLSKDPDPRVRAALVEALPDLGEPGVSRLADMLRDTELAVAVEAARVLKSSREDPSIAIPALTQALSRAHLSSDAGDALSAYGIAARSAVPELIKAGEKRALEHIGPPAESDIPRLFAGLAQGDDETRILTAKYLALLGPRGESASGALEAAAERSMKEHVEGKRNPKPRKPFEVGPRQRPRATAEYCASAVWAVTRDTPRFIGLVEKLAIAADEPIDCAGILELPDLSADDCRRVGLMLRHPNRNVRETGLDVLADAGFKAEPLKQELLELARDGNAEISEKAIRTLAAIGPVVGRDVEPVLLSKWNGGAIPLRSFAESVGRLGIQSDAIRAILERGLHGQESSTTGACASALCMTTDDPRKTARMIIGLTGKRAFTDRLAISALSDLKGGDELVIPYLVAQLVNDDNWTRIEAIDAISHRGASASGPIAALETLVNDKDVLIRLKAASAIFRISNDPTLVEREFDRVIANGAIPDRYTVIETIAEMKHAGGRFVRYILAELHRPTLDDFEAAINALEAVATTEAVEGLRALAESSDWMVRSRAIAALRKVRDPDRKGRP